VDGVSYLGASPPDAKLRRKATTKPVSKRQTGHSEPPSRDGLVATLSLLPANRVRLHTFRDLPRGCPLDAVPQSPPVAVAVAWPPTDLHAYLVPFELAPIDLAAVAPSRLTRWTGAISFLVGTPPRTPRPAPTGRVDPVLRTRRADRPNLTVAT
jgi:hypothetical protein